MKKIFFIVLALNIILLVACNNGGKKTEKDGTIRKDADTTQLSTAADDKDVKVVAVTYTSIDAKAAASLKEIVDDYLNVKNALAGDDGTGAARAAKAMGEAIQNLDKSLLTAEQKKVYDEIWEDLAEHAEHIGKNGDNIEHQREHFSMMSEDMYDLVKAFGAGRPVYHDHCPMYKEGKGGMWLSETREIKNPYFGPGMPKCGSVQEIIK